MVDATEQRVITAALNWWFSKRPALQDQAKHLSNPEINCSTPTEESLARAAAKYIKQRDRW